MIYRAKCTHIISILEIVMDIKNYNFVIDRQHRYIEVGNEDMARQIELIEDSMVILSLQTNRLKDILQK